MMFMLKVGLFNILVDYPAGLSLGNPLVFEWHQTWHPSETGFGNMTYPAW